MGGVESQVFLEPGDWGFWVLLWWWRGEGEAEREEEECEREEGKVTGVDHGWGLGGGVGGGVGDDERLFKNYF